MRKGWHRVLLLVALVSFVAVAACQKKQAEEQAPPKKAPAKAGAVAETTRVASPDTSAPQPPPGYKSIHQIQLEEHKKKEEKGQ